MKTIRKITVLLLSGLLAMSQPVQHTAFAQGEEIPETEHTAEPELSGETENSPEPADENTEPALTEENGNAQGEETPGQEQPEEPVSSGEPEDSPDVAAEPGTAGETENSPEPADEITEPAPAEGNGNAQAETPDEQKADMDTAEPAEESREQEETRDAGNNWSLDIVFFDSEVDNGHTALTAVDWNATTDHVNVLPARTIKVQITYRNTNSEKAYAPGELTLTIPNMMAGQGNSGNTSAYTSNSSQIKFIFLNKVVHILKMNRTTISLDRKSTRLNSSHPTTSRMPSSA